MTTEQGNKLIAEFLGWKYCEKDLLWSSNIQGKVDVSVFSGWIKKEVPYIKGVPIVVVRENRIVLDFKRRILKYNTSWEELMPAVKMCWSKLREFEYDDEEYLHITEEIFHPDYMLAEFMDANIESIYNRVVEFIEWYNKHQK